MYHNNVYILENIYNNMENKIILKPVLWKAECPKCKEDNDVEEGYLQSCSLSGEVAECKCNNCGKVFEVEVDCSKI